jgi:ATP-dependent DNA helicase RecG
MNIKQTQQDIRKGEGLHREFKEAKDALPQNFFETVCSFLNTDGGTIFLGVTDKGKVNGVDQGAVARMKSDIANLSNNP